MGRKGWLHKRKNPLRHIYHEGTAKLGVYNIKKVQVGI